MARSPPFQNAFRILKSILSASSRKLIATIHLARGGFFSDGNWWKFTLFGVPFFHLDQQQYWTISFISTPPKETILNSEYNRIYAKRRIQNADGSDLWQQRNRHSLAVPNRP